MAEETRRVPAFLSGPTTATAVLLPMRLYVGYWWLKLGLAKLGEGWLKTDQYPLNDLIKTLNPPGWFSVTFVDAANENTLLFQWLIVLAELLFGAMMLAGAVTRVSGIAIALMALIGFIAAGYDFNSWEIPMILISLTLAVAAAGRYLGVDAILKARMVKVPLF
ncbi:MAG: DoxX family membrane protein [Planctomycetes bacterium]|nr:DoxX family membrane protein [Planctomycetota bacterium]